MDILKIVVTLSSTICNFRILATWDMQTDLKKTKVMKAALSLMVKVMLTDPATHRYSCSLVPRPLDCSSGLDTRLVQLL